MSTLVQKLFSLQGRTALIVGASGGIGRALALAFSAAGAKVAVHGNTVEKVKATCDQIESEGGCAVPFAADLSSVQAAKNLVTNVKAKFGAIHILVNCAGTNRRKPIVDVSEEDFDHINAINLRSVFFLAQAVHAVMKAQGGGKIINVGSITTTDGLGGVSVYGATKAAVGQLTRTMALEWAPDNIQVNCLAPGFILTPLTEQGLWGDAHRKAWLEARIPMKRPGQPDELVGAALLLASDASSYITGQIINVDGGYLAGGSWLKEE